MLPVEGEEESEKGVPPACQNRGGQDSGAAGPTHCAEAGEISEG